ncbi:MAG: hypothetical protein KKH01_03875 [Firmicutes bacterium]|nr:hypothetical protein [Bacillota bacterium]
MEGSSVLLYEDSLVSLSNSIDQIVGFEGWNIRAGSLKERSGGVKFYGRKFKEHYKNQFSKEIENQDVISYFDTMSLLKRLSECLDESVKDVAIFMEFSIPYAHQKRIDFLLSFKNTIIILEFSYINEELKGLDNVTYMTKYHEKLVQAMQYQTLLQNMLNEKIKTIPFVVLYHPEYLDKNTEDPRAIKQNNDEIRKLADLINFQYSKEKTASEELLNLLK